VPPPRLAANRSEIAAIVMGLMVIMANVLSGAAERRTDSSRFTPTVPNRQNAGNFDDHSGICLIDGRFVVA